jgi:hypothetical protein
MNVVQFVGVSLALGFFWATFPPAAIVLLVAAIAALAISRIVLTNLASEMSDNRQEYVCAIYESKTIGEAIDNFLLRVDDGIESLSLELPLPSLVRQVVNATCDAGVFATLFNAGVEFFYPDADCSHCEEGEYGCELIATYPGDYPQEITKISENVYRVKGYLKLNGETAMHVTFQNNENRQLVSIERLSGGTESDGDQFRYAYYIPMDECEVLTLVSGEYEGDQTLWLNGELPQVMHEIGFSYCEYETEPEWELVFAGECFGCDELLDGGSRLPFPNYTLDEINKKVKENHSNEDTASVRG